MVKKIIAAAIAASMMLCAVPTIALTSMAYGGNPGDSESGKPTGKTDELDDHLGSQDRRHVAHKGCLALFRHTVSSFL